MHTAHKGRSINQEPQVISSCEVTLLANSVACCEWVFSQSWKEFVVVVFQTFGVASTLLLLRMYQIVDSTTRVLAISLIMMASFTCSDLSLDRLVKVTINSY